MTAVLPVLASLLPILLGQQPQQQPQPDYTPLYVMGGAALLLVAVIALKK